VADQPVPYMERTRLYYRALGYESDYVWAIVADPPERPSTDNVAWDKESTHTRDRGSYLPIEVATELAGEGVFAGLAAHFHGIPTEYSQRKTLDVDAPQVLARLRADGADAAILCPL
jgi:D-proline reductase (dithiol) PrdB